MKTIREYAKENNFKIIGKLTRMMNIDRSCRCYHDEAMNEYLLDTISGSMTIITADGDVI